ncbi:hypothetical protein AAFF_G00238260 [Aldrovandia affinis]|uniref:Uncharacterized protein n=1 Tax=Aldrovandia affinis TaxID=143900 RepID=A0AAD7RH19_9TELE|nr:hypothetical protein AAFF_G00238260 [Aldrovandia affinis]
MQRSNVCISFLRFCMALDSLLQRRCQKLKLPTLPSLLFVYLLSLQENVSGIIVVVNKCFAIVLLLYVFFLCFFWKGGCFHFLLRKMYYFYFICFHHIKKIS